MRRICGWSVLILLSGMWMVRSYAEELDRIAASVNDDVILESDIQWEQAFMASPLAGSGASAVSMDHDQVLERLIDRSLLLEKAWQFLGGVSPEEETGKRIQQLKEKVGGEASLKKILASMNMSEQELLRRVRNQIVLENYIDKRIRMFVQIKPEEIDKYIETHKQALGLTAGEPSAVDAAQMDRIRKMVRVLLREKAVNQQLEALVKELRKKAEIRYPGVDETAFLDQQ